MATWQSTEHALTARNFHTMTYHPPQGALGGEGQARADAHI